jgi:flagellar biosynthesis/type III secretory pathway ATPase
VDQAIRMRPSIADFLRQEPDDLSSWSETMSALDGLERELLATNGAHV